MYYGQIKNCDIADGEGVRVTLFVSGCTNRCEGCFQPQTWDFCYGQEFTSETEQQIIDMLKPDYINGLTLLGGEPFEPENQRALLPFVRRVKEPIKPKEERGLSSPIDCIMATHVLITGRASYKWVIKLYLCGL